MALVNRQIHRHTDRYTDTQTDTQTDRRKVVILFDDNISGWEDPVSSRAGLTFWRPTGPVVNPGLVSSASQAAVSCVLSAFDGDDYNNNNYDNNH